MADYWLKFYIEILDDPKMGRLPDHLWRRFFEMCAVAKTINKKGLLPSIEEIAWMMRIPEEKIPDLQTDLDALVGWRNLLTKVGDSYIVTNFEKRQSKSTDAERKQKQRDKERSEQYSGDDNSHDDVTKRDTNPSRGVRQSRAELRNRAESEQSIAEEAAKKAEKAVDKKMASLTQEERDWLQKIIEAFGEKFANPAQIRTALQTRSLHGETKAWEAIVYYANKGRPIGEGVSRALQALPTWGNYKKYPSSSSPAKSTSSAFDVATARRDFGWNDDQIRQRMAELGFKPDDIARELAGAT